MHQVGNGLPGDKASNQVDLKSSSAPLLEPQISESHFQFENFCAMVAACLSKYK
jgi:hypothetical protein